MYLADLTRKVQEWPLPARIIWQAWWLVALAVLIDVVLSLGFTESLPIWLIVMLLSPFAFMILTMIYDRIRKIGSSDSKVSNRG
jgi:hypothetical protein